MSRTKFTLKRYGPKNFWYIFWTEPSGRTCRRTTGTADLAEAEIIKAAVVLEAETPKEAKPNQLSIATVLHRYYESYGKNLPSAYQQRIYERKLLEWLKLDTVDTITKKRCEEYRDKVRAEGLSVSTVNKRLNHLRAACRYAYQNGELTAAPFIPKFQEPKSKAEFLTRDQVAKLLWQVRHTPHLRMFVRLAVYTGARRRAILELSWDRVDIKDGTVDFLVPGVVYRKKLRPHVPVAGVLVRALRSAKKRKRSTHVVEFRGRPMRTLDDGFEMACYRAGLGKVTPHMLKHTAATWALRNVRNPWKVSGLLATSVKTLTEVYGHHFADDLRDTANALARQR